MGAARGGKDSGLGPEFTYDLGPWLEVDPALVHYAETGRVLSGLEKPSAVAAGPDGRIFVAGDARVRVFDRDGKARAEFKTAGEPHALAVGPDGTVYVALRDHVETYDAGGARRAAWPGAGERAYLTSVAAGERDVFVADAGAAVVLRHDPSGRLVNRVGEKDPARRAEGIVIPSPCFDVALAPDGMLWVVNPGMRRVECYTYDGQFRFAWGKTSMKIEGFCGCCNPTHVAILPDGSFVTSEKGLPRVKVYDPEGAFRSVVAPPAALRAGATGLDLAADAAGRILVLDPREKAVRVFERKAQERGHGGR